jgi:hypothetical protein
MLQIDQDESLEIDQIAYLQRVENLRLEVERTAFDLLKVAQLVSIAKTRLEQIAKIVESDDKSTPIPKPLLDEYSTLIRLALDSAKILVIASDCLSTALGLEKLVKSLQEAKND